MAAQRLNAPASAANDNNVEEVPAPRPQDQNRRTFVTTAPGEDGWSAPMLMALSGHENIRSLAIHVDISAEAVDGALAQQVPARRHH